MFLVACQNESNSIKINDNLSIEFEQIGYYKSSVNTRCYTFFINATDTIDINNIPDKLWEEIEKHGLSQTYTEGKATQSFYYLSKSSTPDVTSAKDYDKAINRAYDAKPLAVVYQDWTGSGLFKKSESSE